MSAKAKSNPKPKAKRTPIVTTDPLDIMCLLRNSGWLVVLKCVPDFHKWLDDVGLTGFSKVASLRRWCCEAQWLGKEWRHSQTGFGEHPRDAVLNVYRAIAEDEARRTKA